VANASTLQAIGVLLRNQLYAGIVDVPEYDVRAKRGDFEPLNSEISSIADTIWRYLKSGSGSAFAKRHFALTGH
jgi:hypothetical protein